MGEKEVNGILNSYAKELKKKLKFKRLILFGSYARGTANKDSDIDTAIVVKNIPGDFLSISAMLWEIAAGVDTRIEPVLIEEGKDDSGFLESISEYGRVIKV